MEALPLDSYEIQVARAKARNPRLILIDALHTYSLEENGKLVDHNGPEFNDSTVAVETFVLELQDEKNLKAGAPTFKVTPVLRIASDKWEKTPDQNTQIVDEFPITEKMVLRLMTEFLDMNEYFSKNSEFLWGVNKVSKERGMNYGS